jgi:glycosyltransferase involved in cell wall biosynthesis
VIQQVTVIIPCYNASRWIRDALESVVAQGLDSLEVVVVDDGSTDGGADIVQREFEFARLVRTANQGASKARNLGTSLAGGEFIQYLDADDRLAPGKIRVQLDALKSTNADVAYGDWQRLVQKGGAFEPGELVQRQMQREAELDLFGDFWCPPAAYLFRREIVDRIGGWNEGLPVIQDARFALDCALHGATFIHCSGVMAYYRVHDAESLSRRSAAAFHRDVYANAGEVEKWWHGSRQRSDRAWESNR